jgi:D-alanyl-lipoteichoic acid acyltransferase DltB (MBOAT superfamily)
MGPLVGPTGFAERLDAAPQNRSRRMVWIGIGLFALGNVKLAIGGYVIELYFQHFFAPGSRPLMPEFFSPNTHAPWWQYWIGAVLFHLRIYCIFGGYADLARGMCSIIGMQAPRNFLAPFLSRSLTQMWQRWHCTFAAWGRDVVYIPLGGNRRHPQLNSFVTFLYAGGWHFPYLNAPVFAVINTVCMTIERWVTPRLQRQREAQASPDQLGQKFRLADGPIGIALGILWANLAIAIAGACVFDWYHGGIHLLQGLVGLR